MPWESCSPPSARPGTAGACPSAPAESSSPPGGSAAATGAVSKRWPVGTARWVSWPPSVLCPSGGAPAVPDSATWAAAPRVTLSWVTGRGPRTSLRLLPCLFVRVGYRGRGVSHALVDAAISLAQRHGAAALEAWPSSAEEPLRSEAFVGREQLSAELRFSCVARPVPERVIMCLGLDDG